MKFIVGLIGLLCVYFLGSLIFWGLGNLIIYVFGINYTWTFLHGLVTFLIYQVIQGIFQK